jgi:hypothetical protein
MPTKVQQLKNAYEEMVAVHEKNAAVIEYYRKEYTDDTFLEEVEMAVNGVGVNRKKVQRIIEAYNTHCAEVDTAIKTYHSQAWERMTESELAMMYARNAYLQAMIEGTN